MSENRPNILFFFPDQLRPDWAHASEGLDIRTPNLDRLRRLGTTFTRAYTSSPVCAPARACLASGRAYGDCGVWNNYQDYPLDLPTYYQALRAEGYRVAGVGKFDLHKDVSKSLHWGLDGSRSLHEWGFTEGIDNEGKIDGITSYREAGTARGPYLHFLQEHGLAEGYTGPDPEAHITDLPQEAYCDTWISNNGLEFLRNFPQGTPWHLVINFAGPHSPFDVTQEMADSVRDRTCPMPYPSTRSDYPPSEHMLLRRHYIAMIEHIDMQVGRFLDAVEERGELDNTLIVFSSDHGEMLGDHDRFGKAIWYEASTHIPLIIAGPGVRAGVRSDALVSLHDLAATFIDVASAKPMPDMEARSLRSVLSGETDTHRDVVHSGYMSREGKLWDLVTDGRYKLVTTGYEQELYDIETDPHEMNDIVNQRPDIVGRLNARRSLILAGRVE